MQQKCKAGALSCGARCRGPRGAGTHPSLHAPQQARPVQQAALRVSLRRVLDGAALCAGDGNKATSKGGADAQPRHAGQRQADGAGGNQVLHARPCGAALHPARAGAPALTAKVKGGRGKLRGQGRQSGRCASRSQASALSAAVWSLLCKLADVRSLLKKKNRELPWACLACRLSGGALQGRVGGLNRRGGRRCALS